MALVPDLVQKYLTKRTAYKGVLFWYSGLVENAPELVATAASTLAFRLAGTAYATLTAAGLAIDNIHELTAANGVLLDGVRMKDGAVQLAVSAAAATAAAGTTTADATVLPAATSGVYPTSAADGTKGVRLHASDAVSGRVIVVGNTAAAVLKIYPNTGGTINAGAADAALSTTSGKGAILVCVGGNAWVGV